MKERLQQRLRDAQRVLRELKREYGNCVEYYSDQLAYIKHLREHLAAIQSINL